MELFLFFINRILTFYWTRGMFTLCFEKNHITFFWYLYKWFGYPSKQ
jgi:hypothetical protein